MSTCFCVGCYQPVISPVAETEDGGSLCAQCLTLATDPAARKAKAASQKADEKAKNAQKAFLGMPTEKRVQDSLVHLRTEKGWRLTKVPTPAHYQRQTVTDFVGYDAFGRALAVEVKSTKKNTWSLAVMPEHQQTYLADLDAVAHKDAGAYVLLHFITEQRWFLIPWRALRNNRIAHLTDPWLVAYESEPLHWWKRKGGMSAP